MRLLMIRHGDPDYEHDCLTARGKREAEALAQFLRREQIDYFYVSPLGRAQETAGYTLRAMGRTAETMEFLQEFPAQLDINGSAALQQAYPDTERCSDGSFQQRIVWDMTPRFRGSDVCYRANDLWRQSEVAARSDMEAVYDRVCADFDKLLARHGYVRQADGTYRVERANRDTLALFCHFGITAALMSHLWDVSPFAFWHGAVTSPTSVTELYTEEREPQIAGFRCARWGDCSHLYAAGITPSFSARFCELFSDEDAPH